MNKGRIVAGKVAQGATLPEIGKIKIGEKRKNASGKEYPVSLEYFRATGNFANQFTQIFGKEPKELHVAFVSDNLEEACYERFESWDKGKRYGYGNGQTFTIWDQAKGEYVKGLGAKDPKVRALKWDRTLTLRFVLLKMKGILGYWSFQTKAKEVTIPSVIKSFDMVREKAGTIVGFPFSLTIEKRSSFTPGVARTYPVVSLIPNFTEETIESVREYIEAGGDLNRITTNMITSGAILKQLPSGQDSEESVIEDAEVVEEGGVK